MEGLASAELVKLIRVQVPAGQRAAFLESQSIWNRQSRLAAGYLGELIGEGEKGDLHIMAFWRSRRDYESWMETDHDRIAALAGAARHYETIEIETVDLLPT